MALGDLRNRVRERGKGRSAAAQRERDSPVSSCGRWNASGVAAGRRIEIRANGRTGDAMN
jgi:hypothetical protein